MSNGVIFAVCFWYLDTVDCMCFSSIKLGLSGVFEQPIVAPFLVNLVWCQFEVESLIPTTLSKIFAPQMDQ